MISFNLFLKMGLYQSRYSTSKSNCLITWTIWVGRKPEEGYTRWVVGTILSAISVILPIFGTTRSSKILDAPFKADHKLTDAHTPMEGSWAWNGSEWMNNSKPWIFDLYWYAKIFAPSWNSGLIHVRPMKWFGSGFTTTKPRYLSWKKQCDRPKFGLNSKARLKSSISS